MTAALRSRSHVIHFKGMNSRSKYTAVPVNSNYTDAQSTQRLKSVPPFYKSDWKTEKIQDKPTSSWWDKSAQFCHPRGLGNL